MKRIKLSEIDRKAGTQTRATINPATVEEYAQAMKDGAAFPPVVLFGKILADGFHRIAAAEIAKLKDFPADIRIGSKTDALAYALSANGAHGLRRTNADKKNAVRLALEEWPDISNKEISRRCAVSDMMVASVRNDQPQDSCGSTKARVGADGKKRKVKGKKTKEQLSTVDSSTCQPATNESDGAILARQWPRLQSALLSEMDEIINRLCPFKAPPVAAELRALISEYEVITKEQNEKHTQD
jgi:hypothetical protein